MNLDQLKDQLELSWYTATERGDRRGVTLALLGLVEVELVEAWDEAVRSLDRLRGYLPLKAENWTMSRVDLWGGASVTPTTERGG